MSFPSVSVIIPTFNRAKEVQAAIQSVLTQSHPATELIVVDDGSTDSTQETLSNFNDQIRIISQANLGVSAARNQGVSASKGELIAFLDSDDQWHSDMIDSQLNHFQNNQDVICQSKEIWIRNGKRVNPRNKHQKRSGDIFKQCLELCAITPSSVFMKRELFDEFNGFDEKLPACEDYDLWLKISAKYRVGLIDEFLLTRYGGHSDQLSAKFPAMDRFRIYSILKLLKSYPLSGSQLDLAIQSLKEKTMYLELGAKKRGKDLGLSEMIFPLEIDAINLDNIASILLKSENFS